MHEHLSKQTLLIVFGMVLFCFFHTNYAMEKSDAWTDFTKAAQLYRQNGSQKELILLLRNSQKHAEDPVLFCRASFLLAEVYRQQSRFAEADEVFEQIYKCKLTIPVNLLDETRLRQAQLYLFANQINKAMINFTFVAVNDSSLFFQEEARFALAWYYANQYQWQICDSLLQQIILANPVFQQDQRMNNLLARKALSKNEPETAIELLKDTQNKEGLQYLAQAYEMAGKQIVR